MSSNRNALDALAQEGIPMTEEQLLRETQRVQSNGNGSTPAPAKGAGEALLVTRRGRQRTPKSGLMSVLCRLEFHQGLWTFLAEGNCTQTRQCGRCGSVRARIKHQREWLYLNERTDEQVRTCRRCNTTNGERTQHEWGAERVFGGDKRSHQCLRCGKFEEWVISDGD